MTEHRTFLYGLPAVGDVAVETVGKAHAYLAVGEAQRVHIQRTNALAVFNGQVSALVEEGNGFVETLQWQVESSGWQADAIDMLHVDGRHLCRHVDECTRRAAVEPVVTDFLSLEYIDQTERVVDVGLSSAEMVTVVHLF